MFRGTKLPLLIIYTCFLISCFVYLLYLAPIQKLLGRTEMKGNESVTAIRNESVTAIRNESTSQVPSPWQVTISTIRVQNKKKTSFNYKINEKHLCNIKLGESVELLVGVFSAPSEFRRRKIIRNEWGAVAKVNPKVRLIFILGVPSKPKVDVTLLHNESNSYHDIIQGDFKDTYRTLALKSFALFQWIHHFCGSAKFILKIDSDTGINLPQLLKRIHTKKIPDKFICGAMGRGASVVRDKSSKWYVSREQYPNSTFPTYCIGCAFMVSMRIAKKISEVKIPPTVFPVDDAYTTGILRLQLNESIVLDVISYNPYKSDGGIEMSYINVNVLP